MRCVAIGHRLYLLLAFCESQLYFNQNDRARLRGPVLFFIIGKQPQERK
jgi:hypothetical protein